VSLTPGSRVGAYQIVSAIGAGGMGEVYRAVDSVLKRDVAVKVLPEELSGDPERVARFEREAQLLASLNHPNIAHLYGIERSSGATMLVMELVEGPTLADRLAGGPLPAPEAIAIARQIAEALAAAHARKIVHRDLKPANVKVRPDGIVKVLDFGLAKAVDADATRQTQVDSPTVTAAMTRAGVIMGTASYMSPEQARGEPVDERADIWAFGCVLFELLTGQRAFGGQSAPDVLAGVLRGEIDRTALPPDGARCAEVIDFCLQKDPARRLHSMADVALLLDRPALPSTASPAPPSRRPRWQAAALLLCALAAGVAVGVVLRRSPPGPDQPTRRFELASSEAAPVVTSWGLASTAIAPDGSMIVYDSTRGTTPQLALRRLANLQPSPIAGTEGGSRAFFSPDGREIGFATFTELKRVPLSGGPPATICPVDAFFAGASWGADGSIVFSLSSQGLFRVPASGGTPVRIAQPDGRKGELAYVAPVVLQDVRALLYTVLLSGGQSRIDARRLDGTDPVTVVDDGYGPGLARTDRLTYVHANRLMAVRFDAGRLQTIGSPVPLDGPEMAGPVENGGASPVTFAANGTAVYVSGHPDAQRQRVMWIDRQGTAVPAIGQPLDVPRFVRLSPDGHYMALTTGPPIRGDIWVFDLTGGAQPIRVTHDDHNIFPTWSPDARQIAYLSRSSDGDRLRLTAADGGQAVPTDLIAGSLAVPLDWLPDGRRLLVQRPQSANIWLMQIGDGTMQRLSQAPFTENAGRVSPDGRWVAYSSNQSGRDDIYVRAVTGEGAPIRVSSDGGRKPLWSRDGREVYFENGEKMMAARVVSVAPPFRTDAPRLLFEGGFAVDPQDPFLRFVDVAADGRFLAVQPPQSAGTASLVIVDHWDTELKRLLP
jgi:serine/threonine-protein kinase